MRIDAYSKINQIYKTGQATKVTKTEKVVKSEGSRDQLEISQAGRDYQIAKQALLDTPDVREDLVNNIKSRIEAGTYEVSGSDFASKVIAKYNEQIL